jgi:SPP1 family predicted phage head-tail adaptor
MPLQGLGARGSFAIQAGRFRHRITLETRTTTRDSAGGILETWTTFASGIPAVIEPISGREFFSARQIESTVDTSITIRWRPGVLETMRVLHGSDIYDVTAMLPDADTGRKTISLMCTRRNADGFRE